MPIASDVLLLVGHISAAYVPLGATRAGRCESFVERGQVYERSAIEDWFRTHTTDPMTGEKVIAKAVFPDDKLRARCDAHRSGLIQARTTVGRGGRGGRGSMM